jgi:hypothetical protein
MVKLWLIFSSSPNETLLFFFLIKTYILEAIGIFHQCFAECDVHLFHGVRSGCSVAQSQWEQQPAASVGQPRAVGWRPFILQMKLPAAGLISPRLPLA